MIRFFLKKHIEKNRAFICKEGQYITGFMQLLMKPKNTGDKWTKQEKEQLKRDLKHLSAYVPVLIIFFLPGGALLLPFLADILDRRTDPRPPTSKP